MARRSAGILLFRRSGEALELLLVHPGGPFWARKDDGAWSIPKGEYIDGEDPWAAAQREFSRRADNVIEVKAGHHPFPFFPPVIPPWIPSIRRLPQVG